MVFDLGGDNIKQEVDFIKETTDSGFEKDVIYASADMPIIACFWSNLNMPCKQLVTLLEKQVKETKGKVALVKVNIDKSPLLVEALRIQSVPTVYAFFQGKPMNGFAGLKSEQEVKIFVDSLNALVSGAVEENGDNKKNKISAEARAKLTADAAEFFYKCNYGAAMENYSILLQDDENDADSLGGIGWCLLLHGDKEGVAELVSNLNENQKQNSRIKGVMFVVALQDETKGVDIKALEDKTNKKGKPDDQYKLARAYIANCEFEKGIDTLIAIIKKDREWEKGKAKDFLLEIFEALGNGNAEVSKGRRKLSAVLFS